MNSFRYQAKNNKGDLIEGSLNAESEQHAIEELTHRGLYILSLKTDSGVSTPVEKIKFKQKDLTQFTTRLSDLISSGLPLLRALSLLEKQFSNKDLAKFIRSVLGKIRDGASFSKSLKDFDTLPPILAALVASGEASGNLDLTLKEAGNIFEKDLDLKSKLKSASFYPLLVLGLGLLTVFFLLSFVIPKIAGIFEDMGQELPLITRLVVALSGIFSNFWWAILILITLAVFIFRKYTKKGRGKIIYEEFKFKLPLIKKILLQRELIFFSRTMGMLVKSGVPLVETVELTKSVLSSERFKVRMEGLKVDLKEGAALSQGLRGFIPQDCVDIVAVGEESGNLENSLLKISDLTEKELDYNLKITTQLLEPIMILFVGAVVGVIIIAVLLPVFQLNMLLR